MSIEKFADIYRKVGINVEVDGHRLNMSLDGSDFFVEIDDEWAKTITSYFKAKQYVFDPDGRVLSAYRCVEFQVMRLDASFLPRPEHEFVDDRNNRVTVNAASPEFALSILSFEAGGAILDIIKRRLLRRLESRRAIREGGIRLRLEDLLLAQHTAKYEVPRKINRETLIERGRSRIKACLFKLAYSYNESWELRESIKSRGILYIPPDDTVDESIPRANYIDDLVSYYKVAKSSQFPNQAFLSYYHILEYFFLRVSDERMHEAVRAHVNSLGFSSSYDNLNKLISIIHKNDNTADETEMLKAVLSKYVNEVDLIEYLKSLEVDNQAKTFSDTKKVVFGEKATIRLEEGHALSNTARVIKHIRNSLVHSSDRYTREASFLPFSESESIVFEYMPLVKYLAERTIFATAR